MPIEFRCSQCNQLLRVPDTSGGKNARCPKCQALMQVPMAEGAAPTQSPPPTPSSPAPLAPPPPAFPPTPSFSGSTAPSFADRDIPPQPATTPFSSSVPRGPEGSVGSPPPPPKHPFGASATPASQPVNPYAAPSMAASGYAAASSALPFVPRSGLPWEVRPRSFSSWWDTMSLIIGSPTRAFLQMRQYGGLGSPIMFSIWGIGLPMALIMLLVLPILFLVAFAIGSEEGPEAGFAVAGIGALVIVAIFVMNVFVTATIGALIAAAIYHVCLVIVGGARQGYETTFRVFSFVQGAMFPLGLLLALVPFGGLIQAVWMIVLLILGLSRAHEIPGERATFAVLLPYGVCCAIGFGLFVVLMIAGAMQG